ncbi:hypothetical protein FS837_011785 [Tulasnella sp. UAMH 9824]|nr:hypothetical protein FS837_011785 [Tulasnella sp. UAMH 9824]
MLVIQRPRTLLFPYPYFLESAFWDAPEERFYRQRPIQISDLPDFESSIDLALTLFGRGLGYDVHDDSRLRRGGEAEAFGVEIRSSLLDGSDKLVNSREQDIQQEAQVEHDGPEFVPETPPARKDKGKARAAIQEEYIPSVRGEEPQSTGYDPSFWDQFGGIGALEEEDALVRQLQRFGGETAYPGYAQPGVAGPSGTRHEDHVDLVTDATPAGSANLLTAATAISNGELPPMAFDIDSKALASHRTVSGAPWTSAHARALNPSGVLKHDEEVSVNFGLASVGFLR